MQEFMLNWSFMSYREVLLSHWFIVICLSFDTIYNICILVTLCTCLFTFYELPESISVYRFESIFMIQYANFT